MHYEEEGRKLIREAGARARDMGHSYVGSGHLLMALAAQPGTAGSLLRCAGAEPKWLEEVAAAMDVAYHYLVVMSVSLPVLYILHVTRSAVQGMGNTVLPMVSGIAEFIMRTGGVLLLPALMGETGIFIAEVLAWLGADLILVPSYFITFKCVQK